MSRSHSSLSKSFPGRGSRKIGLKSVTCVTLSFLGRGTTVPFFQDSGKI